MTQFAIGTAVLQVPIKRRGIRVKSPTGYADAEHPAAIDVDGAIATPVVHVGGVFNVSVGAAGANSDGTGGLAVGCLKGTQGRICKAQVTATGSDSPLLIYDNAAGTNAGTVIGAIVASAEIGDQYVFDMPAEVGISIPAQSGAPTITLSYS